MAEFGRKKKTVIPGKNETKQKLPQRKDSEEVGRWQKSVREDHSIAELYELPKGGLIVILAKGWRKKYLQEATVNQERNPNPKPEVHGQRNKLTAAT